MSARAETVDGSSVATHGPATAPDGARLPHDCIPEPVEHDAYHRGPRGRLIGVDAARGLALLGMFAVHIFPPDTPQGDVSVPWALASGKSSALFAVLAGIGLAFMTGRRRHLTVEDLPRGARTLLIRGVLIALIGLLLGVVVGTEHLLVILPYLGVMFVLAVPLMLLRPSTLIALWALGCVASPVVSHGLRAQMETLTQRSNLTPTDVLTAPGDAVTIVLLTGYFPALTWIAYLCLGIGIGRLELGSRRVAVLLTLAGATVSAAAAGLSWLLLGPLGGRDRLADGAMSSMTLDEFTELLMWGGDGTAPTDSWWWLATAAPHSGTPLDLLYTSGVALTVLGGALVLAHVFHASLTLLAVPGSMTLTLYTAHGLLLTIGPEGRSPMVEFTVHVVVLSLFALLWHELRPRGPLEGAVWWLASGAFDRDSGRHRTTRRASASR